MAKKKKMKDYQVLYVRFSDRKGKQRITNVRASSKKEAKSKGQNRGWIVKDVQFVKKESLPVVNVDDTSWLDLETYGVEANITQTGVEAIDSLCSLIRDEIDFLEMRVLRERERSEALNQQVYNLVCSLSDEELDSSEIVACVVDAWQYITHASSYPLFINYVSPFVGLQLTHEDVLTNRRHIVDEITEAQEEIQTLNSEVSYYEDTIFALKSVMAALYKEVNTDWPKVTAVTKQCPLRVLFQKITTTFKKFGNSKN